MAWIEVFAVFGVCHMVGDFLLQTTWQARNKHGGLGPDPLARRALVAHVTAYTLAFLPALVWLAGSLDPARMLAVLLLVSAPHMVIDDGRLVYAYALRVKHMQPEHNLPVVLWMDQSFHLVSLFLVALLVVA